MEQLVDAVADREAQASRWLEHEHEKSRLIHVLAGFGAEAAKAAPVVLSVLRDEEAYRDTRFAAKKALIAMGRGGARALVGDVAREPSWEALEALGGMAGEELAAVEELAPVLIQVLRGDDEGLARSAAWIAMRLGPAGASLVEVLRDTVTRYADDEDTRLVSYAVEALVNIGPAAQTALRALLASERRALRWRVALEMAATGGDRAVVDPVLREMVALGDERECAVAAEALNISSANR